MRRSLRRKLTMQLTPLLDLLLIVFFAQYMELQRLAAEAQVRSRESVAEAQRELEEIRQARDALRSEEQRLTRRVDDAEEQRRVVGALAAELFQVPEELAAEALLPEAGTSHSPEEIEALRRQLREFARMNADELIHHLLTYNELRKRADVWDLYMDRDGVATLDTGDNTFTFRASTPDDFASELFARYRTLPQPKGLVIILLSYADVTEARAQAARQGLRLAAERMREDSGSRSRFEYANLGLRPRETGPGE